MNKHGASKKKVKYLRKKLENFSSKKTRIQCLFKVGRNHKTTSVTDR